MVDETAPLRPDSPALYSSTKAKAEQAVIAAAGDELETRRRPPAARLGPGDTTILPVLVDDGRSGRFAWIGGGRHLTSTTHVDNVVEGLVLAAEQRRERRGLLRHRRRADRVPRVHHAAARDAGRRGAEAQRCRAAWRARSPAAASASGRCCRCPASRR